MPSPELVIIVVGTFFVAFGAVVLYFGSPSAQKRFNPNNEK